jgi:hypothetical protein
MPERQPVNHTQWAAQFAVASELCKLKYEVALTLGNHPAVDLMVRSPAGTQFSIDVKGLHKPNFWPVKPKDLREHLYYVFAYVPKGKPNEFFVPTQSQINDAIYANWNRYLHQTRTCHVASGSELEQNAGRRVERCRPLSQQVGRAPSVKGI